MDGSDSEIVSSDISCEESFETEYSSDGSSCDNEDFSCSYLGEPEYTEQQAKSMKFSASSSSDDELNSSRLENLHWCTGQHLLNVNAVKSLMVC